MARRKGPRRSPLMARVEPEVKARLVRIALAEDESVAKTTSRAIVAGLAVIDRKEGVSA